MRSLRAVLAAVVVGALSFALAACAPDGPSEQPSPVPGGAADSHGTIALLLPESKTARYEAIDRPMFARVIEQRCPECTLLYSNAGQDAARQQAQAESALTQGAQVLVLGAVDSKSAASIIASAHARGAAVVAYDRFLRDVDYYVSFDSEWVGRLQGEALVRAMSEAGVSDPEILVVNGSPTDSNSAALRRGLARALADTDVRILAEFDTPDWSPDLAQEWVGGQTTQFSGRIDGVYAGNDGTAAGAISALRAAGMTPVPPVVGQDAELAAVQRIVDGDQYMTVFKAFSQQARTAAELAVRLVDGQSPQATARVDGVPSILLAPLAVTRDTIRSVLISGGVYSAEQICVEPYVRACNAAGLTEQGKK